MLHTFVDLFAGCGGLSLGMQNAGWTLKFAVEQHKHAFNTYQTNLVSPIGAPVDWPSWLPQEPHDIVAMLEEHRNELCDMQGTVDLLAGGPPCQGFSTNGRRRQDDPRNLLVASYLEMVSLIMPKMVLLENVRGFTSMRHKEADSFSSYVASTLETLGYDVWSQLIKAADSGVPQVGPGSS